MSARIGGIIYASTLAYLRGFISPVDFSIMKIVILNVVMHMVLLGATLSTCMHKLPDGRYILSPYDIACVSATIVLCGVVLSTDGKLRSLIMVNATNFLISCLMEYLYVAPALSNGKLLSGSMCLPLYQLNRVTSSTSPVFANEMKCYTISSNTNLSTFMVVLHPSWLIVISQLAFISCVSVHGAICARTVHKLYQSISKGEIAQLRRAVESYGKPHFSSGATPRAPSYAQSEIKDLDMQQQNSGICVTPNANTNYHFLKPGTIGTFGKFEFTQHSHCDFNPLYNEIWPSSVSSSSSTSSSNSGDEEEEITETYPKCVFYRTHVGYDNNDDVHNPDTTDVSGNEEPGDALPPREDKDTLVNEIVVTGNSS